MGGGGRRDSHKTCKRLLITLETTFSYFSLKYYKVSQGLMAIIVVCHAVTEIAQLGERQTEDLKVPGSNPESSHDF